MTTASTEGGRCERAIVSDAQLTGSDNFRSAPQSSSSNVLKNICTVTGRRSGSSGYHISAGGPLQHFLRAIYVSTTPEASLGLTALAPPGRKDGRPSTAAATVADTQTGCDPHSMVWTSIPTSDSPPELPQSFKSAALTSAVARREQASNALRAASTNAASLATAADPDADACSSTISPPAKRSAGPQRGNKRFLWHPQHLPKPKATDFVVVLKPRTQLSLANGFPENGAGRALIAHLGATATRLVTVVMVRERNLILVYTSHPYIADKLIGKFAVPSPAGRRPCSGTCAQTLMTPVME
ncbi:hypothetical protein HPB48_015414 [Haemaphysalis longicornis]|uniref:Uncharacterized protein n=1 Tax=Haemaphysalis longicornis TaxID=44386 RepID=A0A9J6GBF2_HAELO|nr:hypothetical protein HPB48_015414 [Haemaphysalis longicornis]